jgi:hypothetical protein
MHDDSERVSSLSQALAWGLRKGALSEVAVMQDSRRLAMKVYTRAIIFFLTLFVAANLAIGQTQPNSKKKATDPPKQARSDPEVGKLYSKLLPEQKRLVDDYVGHYNETTGSKLVPQEAYDHARLSARTTFYAVTHALSNTKLTDAKGKGLGRAIDLVDSVDEVMGEESGVGGDRQFRVYVYLKPNAVDILSKSQEFARHDNTVYHKGFPISYRLKKGPPSIQFSISRNKKMADVDVDYRSSSFPKGLVNGHLTASNSDVRAGNNLEKHDERWTGLGGWWREVFGLLGSGARPPKENVSESLGHIPLNPAVKGDQGIDKSAHDFLQSWVVDKQPNLSVAYFSRRSYPCLEAWAQKNQKPMAPGMVRLQVVMAMDKFNTTMATVNSVGDVFEPADQWLKELKEAKNAYPSEFRLVSVPSDIGADEECVAVPEDESGKRSQEKFYGTAFRAKQGGNKTMTLLWAQEGGYWKIIAIRLEDSSDEGIIPRKTAATAPAEEEPKPIAGDPGAVRDITQFYQAWVGTRDSAQASNFASQQSYGCIRAPSAAEKNLTLTARIRSGLDLALGRLPQGANLSDMMSSVQPVNDLLRPVDQENSKAFAIMAVPDQMADSFACQNRHLPEKTPELKPADAKYGTYYLSASRLNFGEEESPALLLLWTKEKAGWRVVAWAVEVP